MVVGSSESSKSRGRREGIVEGLAIVDPIETWGRTACSQDRAAGLCWELGAVSDQKNMLPHPHRSRLENGW